VILNVEVYPLLSYLVRPLPRRQLTESKRMFDYYLFMGEERDESALGILLGKWIILNKPTTTSPDMANKSVKCIYVPHNTVVKREG
jgi:hypothetical protein